jgi:hypothetical protein
MSKPLKPFAHIKIWTPELLERKQKWDEEDQRSKMLERERFLAKLDFDYEPLSYAWCYFWTQAGGGRYVFDPVAGPPRRIYVLCGYANEDGHCKEHSPI